MTAAARLRARSFMCEVICIAGSKAKRGRIGRHPVICDGFFIYLFLFFLPFADLTAGKDNGVDGGRAVGFSQGGGGTTIREVRCGSRRPLSDKVTARGGSGSASTSSARVRFMTPWDVSAPPKRRGGKRKSVLRY